MKKYYYIDEVSKLQCGPYESRELLSKRIYPETMVWSSGMPDWINAASVEELAFLFDKTLPIPKETSKPINRPATVTETPSPITQTANSQYTANAKKENQWTDVLPMPKNWLAESIIFSIFCCSPISVVGIFYASKVESLYYREDYEGANRASRNARNWSLAGIAFLPVCYVLLVMLGVFVGVMSSL